jgi:hypothetical protein
MTGKHMPSCGSPNALLATIFTVAFEPGGDRSRMDWNTWSRRKPGTYGRGLLVKVSWYIAPWYWGVVVS